MSTVYSINWMWGAPGPPTPAQPVPPRNTWPRHATGTRRAHQWEIDRLVDGVGEDASHAHAPLYPYLLGIHGTVWGFGLTYASGTVAYPEHKGQELMLSLSIRIRNWCVPKHMHQFLMVLLHNGGSCNACTLKQCITFRCITKQTTLLKGTQAW